MFMASDSAGPTSFLKRDLLQRGWTESLIERFLGAPDDKPHRYGGGHYCVYYSTRVRRAEAKIEWQKERDTVAARREVRRISLMLGKATRDYLSIEVRDHVGDEQSHWSDHPEIDAYLVAQRRIKERELLAKHGIFAALFAINREAKRQRNAARSAWQKGDREELAALPFS